MPSSDRALAKVLVPVPIVEPDRVENEDIHGAQEMGRRATEVAGAALSTRAKQVVAAVVLLFFVGSLVNGVLSYELSQKQVGEAVAIAETSRLNGVAQQQATAAAVSAAQANTVLTSRGLPPVTIPGAGEGPPSDTINAAAAAWALTYVAPDRVMAGDLRVIRPAVDRYFASFPIVTASGPVRNRVAGTMLVYIQLTSVTQGQPA